MSVTDGLASESTIELLVRGRHRREASVAIRAFLKRKSHSDAAVLQACDWYRRLAMYSEGLALLREDLKGSGSPVSTRLIRGRRKLWMARFLNLMGASEFALEALRRIEPHAPEDHRVAANILLANFEHGEALSHFETMFRLGGDSPPYAVAIDRISYADSFAGLGDTDRALWIATGVLKQAREPLLRGIALQALGEYHARAGRVREALPLLEAALPLFPAHDTTPDFGFLAKWLGYVHAKNGDPKKASHWFGKALRILRGPRMRPETWLDIYRLKDELGMIRPEERRRLLHYPRVARRFRALLPDPGRTAFGPEDAVIRVGLASGEYELGRERFLGVPLELRLLGWLRVCGDWGLGATRAKCLIWSGDVESFFQLDDRLRKLVQRIRTEYRVPVRWEDDNLCLEAPARRLVRAEPAWREERPSFLAGRAAFTGGELSDYYRISRTQRSLYLRSWADKEWIAAEGSLPRLRYRVS